MCVCLSVNFWDTAIIPRKICRELISAKLQTAYRGEIVWEFNMYELCVRWYDYFGIA